MKAGLLERLKTAGRKKNRQTRLAVFRVFGFLRVLSTLSIRQRSEIPKKVKVKLRGEHGGFGFENVRYVEKGDCLYNPSFSWLASRVVQKCGLSASHECLMQEVRAAMRKFRTAAHEICSLAVLRRGRLRPCRPPSCGRYAASAGPRPRARSGPPCRTRPHPSRGACRCRSCSRT